MTSPLGTHARRLATLTTDQIVYSVTNFALLVLVARPATPDEFGLFSLVYALYVFAASLNQASVGETAIVTGTDADRKYAEPMAASFLIGVAASALLLLAAPFTPDPSLLLILAAALPLLLAQDAFRSTCFGAHTPGRALKSDLLWAALQLMFSALVISASFDSPAAFLAAWAGAGAISGFVAAFPYWRTGKVRSRTFSWVREHRSTLSPFFIEGIGMSALTNLLAFAVAGVAGLATAGALRAVQTLFAGQQILQSALRAYGLAQLRRVRESSASLKQWLLLLSCTGTAIALAWTATLALIPASFGNVILGETFALAESAIPATGAQRIFLAIGIAAFAGIRVLGGGWSIVRDRLIINLIRFAAVTLGAVAFSLEGAVVALAVTEALSTGVLALRYRQASRH